MFVVTVFVFNKVPIVPVVVFRFVICAVAEVIPVDNVNVPDEIFVATSFVDVILVAYNAPVVILVLIRLVPTTSKLKVGLVVPIPTLPLVFQTKIVLLVPCRVPNAPSDHPNTAIPSVGNDPSKYVFAELLLPEYIIPLFWSSKLTVALFPAAVFLINILPIISKRLLGAVTPIPTFPPVVNKFPNVLPFPFATKFDIVAFVVDKFVKEIVPTLILVVTIFVIVLFVAFINPELIFVVANIVPVVKPFERFNVAPDTLVVMVFVFNNVATVSVVTFKFVTWALADVSPVERFNVPEEIFIALSSVTVRVVIRALEDVSPVERFNVELEIFVVIVFVLVKVAIVALLI